jgi:type IV pilus assembly protein PilW
MQSQENVRISQDAIRSVLNVIEPAIRRAGFGIHPALAFDFKVYPATPCTGTATVCQRDNVDTTDKLVFLARNQRYSLTTPLTGNAWLYQGSSGGLQVAARAGDRFRKGQLMYVVCSSVSDSAVVTLSANVSVENAGVTTLPLESGTDQYHQQSRLSTAACYAAGLGTSSMVFTLDRYHYYVSSFTDSAGVTTPWLMLDTGKDENGDDALDAKDHLPIAEGIEDFQVAYMMNSKSGYQAPDAGNRDWLFGNAGATAEEPNPALTAPTIDASIDDASRYTAHPANVRAVRVTFTARARLPADAPVGAADAASPIENRTQDSLPATGRYRRFVFSTTVTVPNMESRRLTVF